jgi:hypothetical protein
MATRAPEKFDLAVTAVLRRRAVSGPVLAIGEQPARRPLVSIALLGEEDTRRVDAAEVQAQEARPVVGDLVASLVEAAIAAAPSTAAPNPTCPDKIDSSAALMPWRRDDLKILQAIRVQYQELASEPMSRAAYLQLKERKRHEFGYGKWLLRD